MKSILYITTISNTINRFLIPHVKMLIEQGYKVDVAFNIVERVDPQLIELGCKVHNIEFQRSPFKKNNLSAYRKIKKLVIDEKYDLVHTHTPIASFITRIACRDIDNLKIIYTAHGFHFYRGAPIKNWLLYYPIERLVSRWTDSIVTMNEEDYSYAKNMKLRRKDSVYKVNGVGLNLNRFSKVTSEKRKELRNKYEFNDNDFILFYAAELNYNKHQDLLIYTINLLKDKVPNIKLLLAGEGDLRKEYEVIVEELKLEKYVQFLGFRKDIQNILKISDIAVASSRREGLPVNVMEAMATGLPLVVTDCRGQRDLISDGINGYIVKENNVELFYNRIIKIYNSKKLMKEMGENSIKLIKPYSIEYVIEEMENIYNEI